MDNRWKHTFAQIILVLLIVAFPVSSIQAGQANVLVCDIWPPYQIKTPDGLTGFSVEVIRAVYARMKTPIDRIEAYPWKRALEMIQHNNAQALFSANFSADRTAFAIYPDTTIIESPWVIWTHENKRITSLEDLKGKTIGVVFGYSYTQEFWFFIETYCNIERVHSDDINFKKLSAGRLDATIAEYGNGHYLTSSLGIHNLKAHLNIPIKKDGLYLIFNKKQVSRNFVKHFSDTLKSFKDSVSYQDLRSNYFGTKP